MISSMTGFATRTFSFEGQAFKMEMKSLNHRFLDVKLRIPRDFSAYDLFFRGIIEKKIQRGSVEFWIEVGSETVDSGIAINREQAARAFQILDDLKTQFGLVEKISLRDVVNFPDVIEKRKGFELDPQSEEKFKVKLGEELNALIDELLKVRAREGENLKKALLEIAGSLSSAHARLSDQRSKLRERAQEKIRKRIEQCFEAYTTNDDKLRAMMESRIAQEIALSLDRMDVEEELTRFKGHIEAIQSHLKTGGAVGKKLDFMFQEIGREINTLGNKSQDLEISHEVIDLKMKVEQMREQSLNLE